MKGESFLLFLLFCWLVSAQTLAQQDLLLSQQTNLSEQVRSALLESRRSMESANEYFNCMIASLEERNQTQSEELMTLWKHWTDTTNSLETASLALEQSSVNLEKERLKVKIFWRIALIIIIGKAISVALYLLRVPVPRLVDIIL